MSRRIEAILTLSAVTSVTLAAATYSATAGSQTVDLNYETLSAFEEPLATRIGNVTYLLRGLIDVPIEYDLEDRDRAYLGVVGNFQLSAETQLPNRMTVGVAYFGQYENRNIDDSNDDYTDNVAGFISGSWGTVLGGNVSGLVREETRRGRGVGNAELAFDDNLGELQKWSGGYTGRFGPLTISGVIDEDDNYDVGVSFQRPIGNKDFRFTARHTDSLFTAVDGVTRFDSLGFGGVGEFIYGSTRYDLGVGYEKLSPVIAGPDDAERWYASTGFSTKKGLISLSAEGHYGEIEGQEEISAAIGLGIDIARGLSANLGINYEDAQININGLDYLDRKDTKAIVSLRYGF